MARDECRCIFCGSIGAPNAHVIPRSHGGLGIEQNIVTACINCHDRMDNSEYRDIYLDAARRYLERHYGDLSVYEVTYHKGGNE